MKRKLVSFDAFKKIEETSVSTAGTELASAEEILADILECEGLDLHCFGENDVVYKAVDGNYVHANYSLTKERLAFENIEQIVVDEDTQKAESRKCLSNLLESLLEENKAKAEQYLETYLEFQHVKNELVLGENFKLSISKPTGKHSKLWHKKQPRSLVAKRIREMKKTKARLRRSPGTINMLNRKKQSLNSRLGSGSNPRWRIYARKIKNMKEWASMCENVFDYVNHNEYGPTIQQTEVNRDEKGNVVAVSLPTSEKRNEARISEFNLKNYDQEMKTLRNETKVIHEDNEFCKAIAYLKRQNNISNDEGLETTLESIVTTWPNLMYLTQQELSECISTALETTNVVNYDDSTCEFMAEGILRTAVEVYPNRVEKITKLAGQTIKEQTEDSYLDFKAVVDAFYPQLDENDSCDMKVFADLYKALKEVYQVAEETSDEVTKAEVSSFIEACVSVLERKEDPNPDVAGAIAEWLYELTESNLEGEEWKVSEKMHVSTEGDPVEVSKLASKSYSPASDFKGSVAVAPVSDGKSYKGNLDKEMQKAPWSDESSDTFPNLKNPHMPAKQGEFTMKGEKGADKEDGLGSFESGDTLPKINNPYLPKGLMPKEVQ